MNTKLTVNVTYPVLMMFFGEYFDDADIISTYLSKCLPQHHIVRTQMCNLTGGKEKKLLFVFHCLQYRQGEYRIWLFFFSVWYLVILFSKSSEIVPARLHSIMEHHLTSSSLHSLSRRAWQSLYWGSVIGRRVCSVLLAIFLIWFCKLSCEDRRSLHICLYMKLAERSAGFLICTNAWKCAESILWTAGLCQGDRFINLYRTEYLSLWSYSMPILQSSQLSLQHSKTTTFFSVTFKW